MIYFIRHGETEWNKERRYQGALNSKLTENGINQMELICNIFAKEENLPNPLKVYTSPLGRAYETAKILARYINVELIIEKRLREVSLGSWDGKTKDEISQQFPNVLDNSKPYNWYFFSPDGEKLITAKHRVESWLNEFTNQTVCVVAHGLIGRVLMGVYLGLDEDEFLKMSISQDSYYKIYGGKIYAIGQSVLHSDEA